MKKSRKIKRSLTFLWFLCVTLLLLSWTVACTTSRSSYTQEEQKTILEDVVFTFNPADYDGSIESIQVIGEFLFYNSNLDGNTDAAGMLDNEKVFIPSEYQPGMAKIGGLYFQDMEYDEESGLYSTTISLPPGRYPYQFAVNTNWTDPMPADAPTSFSNSLTSDGTMHGIASFAELAGRFPDPKNIPMDKTPSGHQSNSILEVGSVDIIPQNTNPAPSKRGNVEFVPYKDINGDERYLGVYLPVNYDPNASEPFKVIFASHGAMGNEVDWFHQGGINNIMDNLIDQDKTESAVLVTMNNGFYAEGRTGWKFPIIKDNLIDYIIPFIEDNYNVSSSSSERAFCGLSMGGMTTSYLYMYASDVFSYFGSFSGAICSDDLIDLSGPLTNKPALMIGTGEEDFGYNMLPEISAKYFIGKLNEANMEVSTYFVPGAHDWVVWPTLFTYFAENVLWK